MRYDLDISIDDKLSRLQRSTAELDDNEYSYSLMHEDAWQPSHVADYENWKMTNKRNKR